MPARNEHARQGLGGKRESLQKRLQLRVSFAWCRSLAKSDINLVQ